MNPVDKVLDRVREAKRETWGWKCECPAHEDGKRSMSIREQPDGTVLLHCFAGCPNEAIVAALDLQMKDLFPETRGAGNATPYVQRARPEPPAGPAPRKPKPAGPPRKIVATYDYRDLAGVMQYQAVRYEPKDFRQRRSDGRGGWIWDLKGVQMVLFKLREVTDAIAAGKEVWLVEGEKDVLALTSRRFAATCMAMGAGKWLPEYTEQLRGAQVVMCLDRDIAGWEHGQLVIPQLQAAGIAIRCVAAGEGKDAFDHFAAGRTEDEFEPFTVDQVTEQSMWPEWVQALFDDREEKRRITQEENRARRLAARAETAPERPELAVVDGGAGLEHEPIPLPPDPPDDDPPVVQVKGEWEQGDPLQNLTDTGNALRLLRRFGENLRFCHLWGRWLVWDGSRWMDDQTGGAPLRRMSIEMVQRLYADSWNERDDKGKAMRKWAMESESKRAQDAMTGILKQLPGIPITPEQLDRNPMLAGCQNGTLDLETGTLRPARRQDMITRLLGCEYDPDAKCPEFDTFLATTLHGDQSMIDFLRVAMGYTLTGSVEEEVFYFLYGPGGTGKGTLMDVMMGVMGEYADVLRTESLMATMNDKIPNDIAKLKGARLVFADETDEGRRWNESLLKTITGGGEIAARFMRGEEFKFRPSFKLWLTGNYRPDFRGFDEAIERRLRIVKFDRVVPPEERDNGLKRRLVAKELPGVLAMMVRGCMEWSGMGGNLLPAGITDQIAEYRDLVDSVKRYIEECCVVDADPSLGSRVGARALYQGFIRWAKANQEFLHKEPRFADKVKALGHVKIRTNTGRYYVGLQLNADAKTEAMARGDDHD